MTIHGNRVVIFQNKGEALLYKELRKELPKMLTGEDIDSWNQLFMGCQLNKSNLDNPTEGFVTNALVCYLRRFGYQIEPPFDLNADKKENNKETRLFLLKLSRQIDHFLKITDKSYSFTYYDLISPTPKKTAHMLYILLNYYYYYNLYKEDVFKMAGDKIRKLEELKCRIENTRADNEHKRQENKDMKSTIECLMEDVPKARAKLKELDKKRTQQEEEYDKINHACQEIKEKLKHLEEQKRILRKRKVTKDEFQELQNQLEQLKTDLEEHKHIEATNGANLNECKKSNATLQNLSKEVERSHEIIPLAQIEQVKESNRILAQSEKEKREIDLQQKKILEEIEEQRTKKDSLEKEVQIEKLKFQSKQNDLNNTIATKQLAFDQKNADFLRLQEQDHISDCHIEEQKNIAEYLVENISEILSGYEM